MQIIDVHTHVAGENSFFDSLGLREGCEAKNLIAYMDKENIEKAVILTLDTQDAINAENVRLSVKDALRAQRDYPGRFIVFASVDVENKNRKDLLRGCIDLGCRGLGEVKHTPFHDERHYDLYEICSEFNLPVLGHADLDLRKLEKVLKDFPKVNFIIHGNEFWANFGYKAKSSEKVEGYPKGPVADNNQVALLLEKHANLFADISAGSGYNALSRDPEYGKYFANFFHHKLIFGTDWPCLHERKLPPERFGEDRWHLNILKEYLNGIPELERVLSGNIKNILYK